MLVDFDEGGGGLEWVWNGGWAEDMEGVGNQFLTFLLYFYIFLYFYFFGKLTHDCRFPTSLSMLEENAHQN